MKWADILQESTMRKHTSASRAGANCWMRPPDRCPKDRSAARHNHTRVQGAGAAAADNRCRHTLRLQARMPDRGTVCDGARESKTRTLTKRAPARGYLGSCTQAGNGRDWLQT